MNLYSKKNSRVWFSRRSPGEIQSLFRQICCPYPGLYDGLHASGNSQYSCTVRGDSVIVCQEPTRQMRHPGLFNSYYEVKLRAHLSGTLLVLKKNIPDDFLLWLALMSVGAAILGTALTLPGMGLFFSVAAVGMVAMRRYIINRFQACARFLSEFTRDSERASDFFQSHASIS